MADKKKLTKVDVLQKCSRLLDQLPADERAAVLQFLVGAKQ
jgi:hypothetical protein